MTTIHIEEQMSPEVITFLKKEWAKVDIEYFGKEMKWNKQSQFIAAYENNALLGVLELGFQAGVMHIEIVIAASGEHGKGIGKLLMEKAEEIARKEKLHKIYLETGKTWGVTGFYEKLGYHKTGELPRHYGGQDYVVYSKFLA